MATTPNTTVNFGTWRGKLEPAALWQWWLAGLAGCLPSALRQRLQRGQRRLLLHSDAEGLRVVREVAGVPQVLESYAWDALDGKALAKLLKAESGLPIVLQIPAQRALAKELMLPLAAANNLHQVLGYEMDRLTPFKANQLYYDALLLEQYPQQRRIKVQLVAVPRPEVDNVLQQLASVRVVPDVVQVLGMAPRINLLPLERRPRRGIWAGRLLKLLIVLSLSLSLAAALLPLWQYRSVVIGLQKKVDTLQRQSGEVLNLREQLDKASSAAHFLTTKKQSRPPLVELLRELTNILPDNTWLERLQVKGEGVQLIGQSASASALIGIVEASPWLHEAAFASPVTNDRRTNKERFVMSAKITPAPPPASPPPTP